MRAYVAVTGVFFVIVSITHVVRAFAEDGTARDPWFLAATALALALAAWAIFLLLRRKPNAPAL